MAMICAMLLMSVLPKSGECNIREAEQLLLIDLSMFLPGFSHPRSFNSHPFLHMLLNCKVVPRTWHDGSELQKCTKIAYTYGRL